VFRFSIRDLLWATLVVAMGLGWWADHQETATIRSQFEAASESLQRERLDLASHFERLYEKYPELRPGLAE
jgi:hypothetical protein